MPEIVLAVIDVDALRALESGKPEVARQMDEVVRVAFPAPEREPGRGSTLIGKLGPLLKRPIETPVVPRRPLPSDAAAIMEGRYVPKSRSWIAWDIVMAWAQHVQHDGVRLEVSKADLHAIDRALGELRYPPLHTVLGPRRLGLRLPELPQRHFGWTTHTGHLRAEHALQECIDAGELRNRDVDALKRLQAALTDLSMERGRALVSEVPALR